MNTVARTPSTGFSVVVGSDSGELVLKGTGVSSRLEERHFQLFDRLSDKDILTRRTDHFFVIVPREGEEQLLCAD